MKDRDSIVEITPYMRLTVERFEVNRGEARAGGEGAIIPLEI